MLHYSVNLKAIRYESTSLNRIIADKSHRVIVALCKLYFCKSFQSDNYVYYGLNNCALDFVIEFYRNRF